MENTPLDEILKEEKPETEVTETVETQAEVVEEKPKSRRKEHLAREYEAQGRDPDTGQFVPKEEEKKEEKHEVKAEVKEQPKKGEFTDKEKAFLRGLEEERRKRQDLERRLAEVTKPQAESEKKTFWDDPEGHFKSFEQRMAQMGQALSLQVSEKIARSKYNDFEEKISEFADSLKNTPGLHAQWLASPDPGEFAYRHGERVKEMREVGSLDNYKKKIEQELRTKLEAEYKQKQEEVSQQRRELPGSLSDVRGAAKQNVPVWKGPTPFEDILKR